MPNLSVLRKKAAEFEQKKQLDKAIATYRQIIEIFDEGADDNVDAGLYNRVGDLLARGGETADAVRLYERAVDLYAERGFFNHALALCNKILRTWPGRATAYHTRGKISAAKGFTGDARANFFEYADRMQQAGQPETALRALNELADLCPDQAEAVLERMRAIDPTAEPKSPELARRARRNSLVFLNLVEGIFDENNSRKSQEFPVRRFDHRPGASLGIC